jgi:RNA polymerase sigma factor (sigma-70 family)
MADSAAVLYFREEPPFENDALTAGATNAPEPIALHLEAADGTVVERCLEGDQEAWTKLINQHKRLIFSVAARFGARHHDCADIFQCVCLELFNGLSQVKNAASLRSWLITVTVRHALRWRKAQSRLVPLESEDEDASPEMILDPDIFSNIWRLRQEEIVRAGVDQLPARAATMLRLLFFEQPPLPYQEIARRLGLATGSIGFIRGRALMKLRKILEQSGCKCA